MRIIIAGDGKVGAALTRQLTAEGYDLTVIDSNQNVLENTMNQFDVMTVHGNCASLDILEEAGARDADLLIAATNADEVNLLCCLTAHTLNPKLHTIARIRNPEYSSQIFRMRESFGLSLSVNPEMQTAREIHRLLQYPGFLRRDTFAKGRVEIVELRVEDGSPLAGCEIKHIRSVVKCQVLICVVVRGGVAFTPDGDFTLAVGDRLYVTAPTATLATLLRSLGIIPKPVKSVMVCGAGRISYYLSQMLIKSGIKVKIVDKDRATCQLFAEQLPQATIVQGDAGSQTFLENENLERYDALVSLTGLDELNMVTSMIGSSLQVPQVITKLGHMESTPLLNDLPLGSIIYPKELCSNTIVRYVRAMKNQTGAAVAVHTIADGQAEALEFVVDETTKHCGEPLRSIHIKKGVLIVAITHLAETQISSGDSQFHAGDTVIVVAAGHTIDSLNDIFA